MMHNKTNVALKTIEEILFVLFALGSGYKNDISGYPTSPIT
jgi:hypothetical protein